MERGQGGSEAHVPEDWPISALRGKEHPGAAELQPAEHLAELAIQAPQGPLQGLQVSPSLGLGQLLPPPCREEALRQGAHRAEGEHGQVEAIPPAQPPGEADEGPGFPERGLGEEGRGDDPLDQAP